MSSSRLAFSTVTPVAPGNNRETAARMAAAARRQRDAAEAARRTARRITAVAASRAGHTTAVEADTDYGRYWRSFDATPEGAREAAEHIVWLESHGELSDIDCTLRCACVAERYPFLLDD
jgi:hypothetical protein